MKKTLISIGTILIFLVGCSSLTRLENQDAARASAELKHLDLSKDYNYIKNKKSVLVPKISIKTYRKIKNDYIRQGSFNKKTLIYNTQKIEHHHWLQILSFLETDLRANNEILAEPQSQKLFEGVKRSAVMNQARILKSRFIIEVASIYAKDSWLILTLKFIDPILEKELATAKIDYEIIKGNESNGNKDLIYLQKHGSLLRPLQTKSGQFLINNSNNRVSLAKAVHQVYIGKVSILALANGLKIYFTGSDEKYDFTSLPVLNYEIKAGLYNITAERPGNKTLKSRVYIRAGGSVQIKLQYPDDPEINPVGFFSEPPGVLLYDQEKFQGLTPKVYDQPLTKVKSFKLVQRKPEEEKSQMNYYLIGNKQFEGRKDQLVVWEAQKKEIHTLSELTSYWKTQSDLKGTQVNLPEGKGTAMQFRGKGYLKAISPRIQGKDYYFAMNFTKLSGFLSIGLRSANKDYFITCSNKKAMANKKDFYKYKFREKNSIKILLNHKEKMLRFELNGDKMSEIPMGDDAFDQPKVFLKFNQADASALSELVNYEWGLIP